MPLNSIRRTAFSIFQQSSWKKPFAQIFFHVSYDEESFASSARGSAIINTTSITAYEGDTALIDYSSTKGAIVSFTRSMAKSLADKGIRVNAVAPGPIWTPLIPATFPEEKVKQHGLDTPMGRPGQPVEHAGAYVLLASDQSSYMTGQTIHVNGGRFIST